MLELSDFVLTHQRRRIDAIQDKVIVYGISNMIKVSIQFESLLLDFIYLFFYYVSSVEVLFILLRESGISKCRLKQARPNQLENYTKERFEIRKKYRSLTVLFKCFKFCHANDDFFYLICL